MELTAPVVAASSSLGALAFAALSPAGPAADNAPEARWLAAQREGREAWLDDLPAAFDAWLQKPAARERRLAALAERIGLTRAEMLAVALSCAAETDAMAGRALAWLQTPVGGARPLAGLVASLAHRFGDPMPMTALAAGAARSSGLLLRRTTIAPHARAPVDRAATDRAGTRRPACSFVAGSAGGHARRTPVAPEPARSGGVPCACAVEAARPRGSSCAAGIHARPRPWPPKSAADSGAAPLFLDGDPPPGSARGCGSSQRFPSSARSSLQASAGG